MLKQTPSTESVTVSAPAKSSARKRRLALESSKRRKFPFFSNANRKRIASALAPLRQADGTFHRQADLDEDEYPSIVWIMDLEDVLNWFEAIALNHDWKVRLAKRRGRREIDAFKSWQKLGKGIVELERQFGALDPIQQEEFRDVTWPRKVLSEWRDIALREQGVRPEIDALTKGIDELQQRFDSLNSVQGDKFREVTSPTKGLRKWRNIVRREQGLALLRSAIIDRPTWLLYTDFAKEWVLLGGKPSLGSSVDRDGRYKYTSPFIRFECACAEPLLARPLSPASMKPVQTWAKKYADYIGRRSAKVKNPTYGTWREQCELMSPAAADRGGDANGKSQEDRKSQEAATQASEQSGPQRTSKAANR